MMTQGNTLLKYETPVLVSEGTPSESKRSKSSGEKDSTLSEDDTQVTTPREYASSVSSTLTGSDLSKKSMEEIINLILPPVEWEEEGQLWRQQVSCTPATRLDVLNLQKQLDMRLEHRQAKETGICPIRRELYSQCFDEIIRQVTINCAERGLLLLLIRDEINMTLAAYQTLYESSCAYGIRKALQAREGQEELESRLSALEAEKDTLADECDQLRARLEESDRHHAEQRSHDAKKHEEKVEFYQQKIQQLKNQLEAILAAKK